MIFVCVLQCRHCTEMDVAFLCEWMQNDIDTIIVFLCVGFCFLFLHDRFYLFFNLFQWLLTCTLQVLKFIVLRK